MDSNNADAESTTLSLLNPPQQRQAHTPPPQKDKWHQYNVNVEDLGICASPSAVVNNKTKYTTTTTTPPPSPRRKAGNSIRRAHEASDTLGTILRKGIVEHQLGLSINLLLLVGLTYALFPRLRDSMSAFFILSYAREHEMDDGTKAYGYAPGPRDVYMVGSFVVLFTGTRAFMLDYVLEALAGKCGIEKRKARVRFAEQSYLLLYYCIYWPWGVYLFLRDTPAALPGDGQLSVSTILMSLWTLWPQLSLDASFKLYYVSQLAFWVQQILVIHLEEKRKDHYQMLTHHFVTVALMGSSHIYRQWRVGTAILVCMDIVDIFLPLAKVLKYLKWQMVCDFAFAAFVVSWILARHVAYGAICWSLYAQAGHIVIHHGHYSLSTGKLVSFFDDKKIVEHVLQPYLNPDAATVAWTNPIRMGFLSLLLFLQGITIMWFIMICRVIVRVIRGEGADDSRSDAEDEDEDEEVDVLAEDPAGPAQPSAPISTRQAEAPKFIEVEADTSDLSFTSSPSRPRRSDPKRKSKGISSGLNFGERKDILNRIGCLSEEQLAREREKRGSGSSPRPS